MGAGRCLGCPEGSLGLWSKTEERVAWQGGVTLKGHGHLGDLGWSPSPPLKHSPSRKPLLKGKFGALEGLGQAEDLTRIGLPTQGSPNHFLVPSALTGYAEIMALKTLKGLALHDILTEIHLFVHRGNGQRGGGPAWPTLGFYF